MSKRYYTLNLAYLGKYQKVVINISVLSTSKACTSAAAKDITKQSPKRLQLSMHWKLWHLMFGRKYSGMAVAGLYASRMRAASHRNKGECQNLPPITGREDRKRTGMRIMIPLMLTTKNITSTHLPRIPLSMPINTPHTPEVPLSTRKIKKWRQILLRKSTVSLNRVTSKTTNWSHSMTLASSRRRACSEDTPHTL